MTVEVPTGNNLPAFLTQDNGNKIAYHYHEGKNPGVIFLHGLMSDMEGSKAVFVEDFCKKRGQSFIRFDCFGHGLSSGEFSEGSLSQWSKDCVKIIDEVAKGPQILVGSSMGGWNMLLSALKRPERVSALIGVAPAPDFTEDLIMSDLTDAQLQEIQDKGVVAIPCEYGDQPYMISKKLLDDGRENLLLRREIELDVPVRLIHGMQDQDVPWQTSLRLCEMLRSTDVEITFVKEGDHRLSREEDLMRLGDTLETLLRKFEDE